MNKLTELEQKIYSPSLDKDLDKGIKHEVLGFKYIQQAITLCLENPDWIHRVTYLYGKVAKLHSAGAANVERAIRHSLEIVHGADKPTNSEFIAAATEEIRLSLK